MRRVALLAFLFLSTSTANALECTVRCPKGSTGSCVELDNGCSCTCRADLKGIVADVALTLRKAGASPQAVAMVGSTVARAFENKSHREVINDPKSQKIFTVTVVPPAEQSFQDLDRP